MSNYFDTNNPIDKLKYNKDGKVWESTQTTVEILACFLIGFCLMLAVYHMWLRIIRDLVKSQHFIMKDDSAKAYFISLWAANTHHIIVFILAFYYLMFP